ncbi:MAG: alcohol dehydrogenase catalytic domain-containing protein [Bowdeniella nasicola]|nr:alcohol dehydrogenase catalytic domain-containing protein [Bowdeniella nasicola]
MTDIPSTQYAVQFTGVDEIEINKAKEVPEIGPTQMLLKVEACGICFSDTKLLHAFDSHPRKSEIVAGLSPEALETLPGYRPGSQPTVPGHEPVARIIKVGEDVTHFKVGDRVLVQADWKHLPTAKSNAAFGYNVEGALQEYVAVDERCVVSPDGEEFLIHVAEEPTAAAIGLIEPWATVEGAYAWHERRQLKAGGRMLVVADAEASSIEELARAATPAEVTILGASAEDLGLAALDCTVREISDLSQVGEQHFDDVIYFGHDAERLGEISALASARSIVAVVLGGARIDRPVHIDVGRIHYDFVRYCGTTGSDPADAYSWIPETGEIRDGDALAIIGAAGPMGLMHTMRAIVLDRSDIRIDATDLSDERLAHLEEVVTPAAVEHSVPMRYINTANEELEPGYDYVVCMVPVPALVAQAVDLAGEDSIVNAFAGIPAGKTAEIDMQGVIERRIFMIGTSGSDVSDMRTVVKKIEDGDYDTTISLDAITGMAGFKDAITSVIDRTSGGKIMVFPQLHDLPLIRLADLEEQLPEVARHLNGGLWNAEAEKALLQSATTGRA